MRHFAGILLGIIFIPVFFALNWSVNYTADAAGSSGGWPFVWLLAAYVAVGVVTGFLLGARSISPMALLLCGLGIAAAQVILLMPRLAGVELNVPRIYDYPQVTDGYLLVAVGAALLFAVFTPSRWRRPKPKDDEFEDFGRDELEPVHGRGGPYDASWGSGRNDYAEEPEAPYEPSTRQMPVTRPGQYDQPPVGEAGTYDQQALGYNPPQGHEEPATAQFSQPSTVEFNQGQNR
ncbi:MAG: hypothetical protein GEV07_18310 [Streptosporangiales bacterium]|nr:hypothetical protein [Streptosporangiales bacterium]